jgi:hypothetical protein
MEAVFEALASYDGEGCPHLAAMQTILDSLSPVYDTLVSMVKDMREADDVDEAQLESFSSIANAAVSDLSALMGLAYAKQRGMTPANTSVAKYMEALQEREEGVSIIDPQRVSESSWFRAGRSMPDRAEVEKDCPHCDGLGQMGSEDCTYCDGTGKVPVTKKRSMSEWLRDTVLRPLGGTGSGWFAKDGHVPGSQGGTHSVVNAKTGRVISKGLSKEDAENQAKNYQDATGQKAHVAFHKADTQSGKGDSNLTFHGKGWSEGAKKLATHDTKEIARFEGKKFSDLPTSDHTSASRLIREGKVKVTSTGHIKRL